MLRRIPLLPVAAALGAALLAPLFSQPPPSPRERDLAALRREIARLEGELSDARARERSLA
ncbi:MAG TPA: hypothetical protein VLF66_19340, partial [Thermoanaerobaculia bacterium]|nr:hypothetical protein [Thermoanaerobaculia bacterium]